MTRLFDKRLAATAGAAMLIAGGASPAAAHDRYDGYSHGYDRNAVNRCVVAAERTATRYHRGARANVTDIRDVRRTRHGMEVRGRIAVRDWDRHGDRQGYRTYRGRGYDTGSFSCRVAYGRIVDLDFRGIRGL